MTIEELQAKIEIQELAGTFSNLEVDVPAQMALFTENAPPEAPCFSCGEEGGAFLLS